MAKKKQNKKKPQGAALPTILVGLILLGALLITQDLRGIPLLGEMQGYLYSILKPEGRETPGSTVLDNEGLTMQVLDVGQADSILIYTGDYAMLIDGGNNGDGEAIADYMQSLGIESLNWVIATHPHEDHIGGLDVVIDRLHVESIMLPLAAHTTKTYDDLLDAVERSGAKVVAPAVGDSYNLGAAVFTVLSCEAEDKENLNESSIVLKLSYGEIDFLLTGDAEVVNEENILADGYQISAEILKVGHHGSTTSTSQAFLDAVSPEVAIISLGAGNTYGHPHKETMEKLSAANIQIYRTDEDNTIIVQTDGKEYHVTTGKKVAD